MSVKRKIVALIAVVSLAGVAGCGNKTDNSMVLKSTLKAVSGKVKPSGPMSPEQASAAIQGALQSTDLPVAFIVLEDHDANGVLVQIETNGGYQTWGGAGRRSVTLNSGMVTATRGLGNDVMSSSIAEVAPLIAGRKPGSGRHTQRHLDGENHTVETVATCQVTRGAKKKLSTATLRNVATTEMVEHCTKADEDFTNTYLVDGRGRTLHSRQWLGAAIGYVTFTVQR